MSDSRMLIIGAVLSMFGVIAAGSLARFVGWLTEEADQSLLKLIVCLLLPSLILHSVVGNPALVQADNVVLPPVIGFLVITVGVLISLAVTKLGYGLTGLANAPQRRTFAFTVGVQNYAYLAIPLVTLLFDRRTFGVLLVHNVGVELAFWTVGAVVLTGAWDRNWWRHLLNPPSLTIVAALTLNVLHPELWFPKNLGISIANGVGMLGQICVPMALLLIGAVVADELRRLTNGLRHSDVVKWALWACLLRAGLLPLLILAVAIVVPASREVKQMLVVQAAMPAAVFSIVLARLFGGNAGVAFRICLFTSLVSLLTIPLWISLGLEWLQLSPVP